MSAKVTCGCGVGQACARRDCSGTPEVSSLPPNSPQLCPKCHKPMFALGMGTIRHYQDWKCFYCGHEERKPIPDPDSAKPLVGAPLPPPQARTPESASPSEPRPVQDWRTMCIVEIAAENPSVAEYCKHWEERAEKAEKLLAIPSSYDLVSKTGEIIGYCMAHGRRKCHECYVWSESVAAEPRRDEREAGLIKNKTTPENRAFWDHIEKTAKEVDSWSKQKQEFAHYWIGYLADYAHRNCDLPLTKWELARMREAAELAWQAARASAAPLKQPEEK